MRTKPSCPTGTACSCWISWTGGKIAHGQYRVKGDEWFLQGHFPDAPVVPGVILCEILAQSAGILMQDSSPRTPSPCIPA
ncbi:MAG: 3-hydroxyacyl-ACP dehydratase FabZ family protein [Evtepia gabavorous]